MQTNGRRAPTRGPFEHGAAMFRGVHTLRMKGIGAILADGDFGAGGA